uniref:Protein RRP5 homolog n=1 Tax=Leptobrachium leishanense TaxID=445787 RepID=A0A8C5QWE8_9ANUR
KKKKKNAVKETSEPFRLEKRKATVTKEPPVTNLHVGMLMMGCIKEVKDFELTLSLPYGFTGYVQAVNVSEAYTKIISEQAEKDSLAPLSDLFAPGMLVRCAVSSLEKTSRGFHSIKLSVNPKDVNKALNASSLRPGMLLSGCVVSSEDHGYLIDLGVVGVKAFLPRQKAQVFLKQSGKAAALRVGQYLNCVIEEVKSDGRIGVSVDHLLVSYGISRNLSCPHALLCPFCLQVFADKVILSFLSSYTGTVDFLHLDPRKSGTYCVDQEVKACILWVNPSNKDIHLTLRQSFLHPGSSLRQLSSSQTGSVLENCTVKSLFKSVGALVTLDDGNVGFAFVSSYKDVSEFFLKEGTSHTVRVLEFSPMDEMLFGTVLSIGSVGMEVKVTSHITGLVPRLHLADVPLHHPELKYNKGLSIRCRVLTIIPSEKKLILTRKKTLINSKLTIISSYQDVQPGLVTHGFILSVKSYGCVVKFYNEVQGLVLRSELSAEHISNPEETFYVGQVVKVRVLDCDPAKERMTLSFRISEEENEQQPERHSDKGNLESGKVVDVKIVQKTETGLNVVTLPEEKHAFLPTMHLSDHVENCELLWRFLEKGDQLPGVMYLSRVLTKKPSLISSVLEGQCIKDMSEVQTGMILTGYVKTIMPYGIFVAFPYGLVGLAPNAALHDRFVPEITDHFKEGQTVVAKVTETDEVKKRFLVTLKMSECAPDDLSQGSFSGLSQCFSERQLLIHKTFPVSGHISTLVPGEKLTVVVEEVKEDGSILFSIGQIPGAETVSAVKHVVSGQKAKVVVLHVDPLKSEVFVSLDKTLLAKKKEKLTENSTHFALVQHIAQEFAVVSLEGSSHLAAIPVTRHFNDTYQPSSEKLHVGQRVSITLKTTSSKEHGLLLAVRNASGKTKRKGGQRKPKAVLAQSMENGLQVGEVVTGTVKTVKPNSVIVSITDKVFGFLHASQITEELQSGSCPTATLRPNQTISCRNVSVSPLGNLKGMFFLKFCKDLYSFVFQVLKRPDKHFRQGQALSATVVGVDESPNCLSLSLTGSRELKEGDIVIGCVKTFSPSTGLIVTLPFGKTGKADLTNLSDCYADATPDAFTPGKFVRCFVLSASGYIRLSLRQSRITPALNTKVVDPEITSVQDLEEGQLVNGFVEKISPRGLFFRYFVISGQFSGGEISLVETNLNPSNDGKGQSVTNVEAKPRLQIPSGFSWDVDVQTLKTSLVDVKKDSSDSEDEEEEPKPKTKKSAKEKALEKKEAEKELSKVEATLLDSSRQPQSADDFDRLVISSPNSSILWLQYMAFHLHATEIEKARAVAERALKTISFREEQEKLNVWVALLNLENMYGTEESLLKVFERAVQYNEPLKVFLQMADIYIKSEKFKEAENLFGTMLKRFRQESAVWLKNAAFLLKRGQGEATHRLLQRALKCLPDKEHVDVITKFAQLDMFESTLSNYPKRTDLWSVYIDLMMKHGSQKEVRDIFERVIHLSLAAKRIKFFFKRYLDYEKKHGTAESIQAVKEKALKYVESKSSLTST